jgi:hypothetical protein
MVIKGLKLTGVTPIAKKTNAHRHPTCSQNMHTDFTPAAYHEPDRLDPTRTVPTNHIPTNHVKGPCRS